MASTIARGVRKSSWTKEEDILLTKYIEKHGEGKWHQVPLRAGLNRCRKSCRLRWLNYLRPNIKRGDFTLDEVDLILRLHKLLGNRWSLIAGRLPGRTGNDIKNYWNSHLQKRQQLLPTQETMKTAETSIVKPRPRTFSTSVPWFVEISADKPSSWISGTSFEPIPQVDDCIQWWNNLLDAKGIDEGTSISGSGASKDHEHRTQPSEEFFPWLQGDDCSLQEGQAGWLDFSTNIDVSELLNLEQYQI